MANEEIKKDEMNLEAKEAATQEILDEELDNVAGGGHALYDSDGLMITTIGNSCSQWKCPTCGTYSGNGCLAHWPEGSRHCPDCKFVKKKSPIILRCTYWTK